MVSMLLAALLQGVAPGAVTPPAAPSSSDVVTPQWLRRPSGEDLYEHYPRAAMNKGLPGRAAMTCKVNAEGLLIDCAVDEESPPGEGFGEAALRMAPLFRMTPKTPSGQSVEGGTVRIPLRFTVDGRSDPLTALLGCYGRTAAAAEKDPANATAMAAYGFFAAQVAFQHARSKAKPEAMERALQSARTGALSNPSAPGPSLADCLAFAAKSASAKP